VVEKKEKPKVEDTPTPEKEDVVVEDKVEVEEPPQE